MSIHSLGYITVNATDLSRWADYGTQVLGLAVNETLTQAHGGNLYLKMDDRPFRFLVETADADSYGSNIAKFAEGAEPVPEKIDGVKKAPLIQGATSLQPLIDPKHPRPRPQIVRQQQVRPAIFEENKFGTKNIGAIGVDAKWSNYGQYLQKMIESVQIQWERILTESRVYPVSGTSVKVVFRMDKKGNIPVIVSVDGTAGDQGMKACTSAITARAPYGDWTDDMIAVLGESQEMTFTFYYQ